MVASRSALEGLSPSLIYLAVAFLVAATFLSASCGQRERANPLDPLNESTRGSPPGFKVVALDTKVDLRWSPVRLEDLTGYNIYRREGTSGSWVLLAGSPYASTLGAVTDSLLSNGVTYYYKLAPLIEGYGEGTSTSFFPATPGSHFPVVVDPTAGTLTKFSADLRAAIWVGGGLYYPLAVASAGERLWLTDLYDGVICLTGDGELLWDKRDFKVPLAVSVRVDGTSAVADFDGGNVTLLSSSGEVDATLSQGLTTPAAVSFGRNGELWVADPGSGCVNKYSAGGTLLFSFTNCTQPRYLDADTASGACWIVDVGNNDVVKLSNEGAEIARINSISTPRALAVDAKNGGCWVSDTATEEVVRVSNSGQVLFRIGKVGRIAALCVSPDDGHAWLADASGNRILVLSEDGSLLMFDVLPSPPTSITVLTGQR